MKKIEFYFYGIAIALTFAACSKKQAEEIKPTPTNPAGPEITTANVTYSNYVGNLIQTKCSGCHGPNGEGNSTWAFTGYESVKNDNRIKNATLVTMRMPKGGSLSAKEKELLAAWFDRNMPQ